MVILQIYYLAPSSLLLRHNFSWHSERKIKYKCWKTLRITLTLILFFLFLLSYVKFWQKLNQSISNHFCSFQNHLQKVRLISTFNSSCRSKKRAWFLQPHLLGMNLGANCNVMRILKCDVDGNRTRNLAILNSFAKKSSKEKVRKFWEKVWLSTKDLNKRFPKTLLLYYWRSTSQKKVFRISRRASIMHGRGHTKEANFAATVVQKKFNSFSTWASWPLSTL